MEHGENCVKAATLEAIFQQATHGNSEVLESELRVPEWVDGVPDGSGQSRVEGQSVWHAGLVDIVVSWSVEGGTHSHAAMFDFGTPQIDHDGVDITDWCNGDPLPLIDDRKDCDDDLDEWLRETFAQSVDWEKHVRAVLPRRRTPQEVDAHPGIGCSRHLVERDDDRDLAVHGELVAEVMSQPDRARPEWSQATGVWQTLRLYRTAGARYVAALTDHTAWQGDHTGHSAAVCDTPEDVAAFFGWGRLAKRLYRESELTLELAAPAEPEARA